ncbi:MULTISPECIES: SDR family oxidoreductase [unclassified Burkholderia]|uniref:SDR family oxidoreductase n=1 Tax=unclassified Burkholderia TaxID=2613784 RepID=UPI0014244AF1|nr:MULTISPECIES: SDR family oxidoreductase [unclassified Burkholderia]NIE55363.1 SDR family oxidoreductase [Burkholderia sp. Ap-955]NIF09002.1 SDR family oxidoreductase [Burkholderia sp. Ax-1735]NIG01960.1 SDR family oxidoreductase [Burkholderia sp. Tr-849]
MGESSGVPLEALEGRLEALTAGKFTNSLQKSLPLFTLGEPRDIAETVTWLCSRAARCVTGQAIPVDGGFTVW